MQHESVTQDANKCSLFEHTTKIIERCSYSYVQQSKCSAHTEEATQKMLMLSEYHKRHTWAQWDVPHPETGCHASTGWLEHS